MFWGSLTTRIHKLRHIISNKGKLQGSYSSKVVMSLNNITEVYSLAPDEQLTLSRDLATNR